MHSSIAGIARHLLFVLIPGFLLAGVTPAEAQKRAPKRDTGQIDMQVVKEAHRAPKGLTMRARLKSITPAKATEIHWRYGGEGQGGKVIRGRFPKEKPAKKDDHKLQVGEWSAPIDVAEIMGRRVPRRFFLTVTTGMPGRVVDRVTRRRAGYSKGVLFEFEFRYRGRVVKTLTAAGPNGGTVTLVIPAYRLVGKVQPDSPAFLNELTGVLEYVRQRANMLESLPWAAGPLPKKYAVVNNIGGYGAGYGYGVRHTDPDVTFAELRTLRQLGVNGFREPPRLLMDMLRRGDPRVAKFHRALISHVMGFPVPNYRKGRRADPEAGCPFGKGVPERIREGVASSLKSALSEPAQEVWGLTVDEIGTVIDRSPQGKAHLSECPRCIHAFQEWLRKKGLTPADFGRRDWRDVKPLNVWGRQSKRPWLKTNDRGAALAAYYTRDFNNYVSAMLFRELRDAFARENAAKRKALQQGKTGAPQAKQPWVFTYALRGNTFLMRGHSLDFFDFYRSADNAIVYETSNREPRIWGWDSYLCDVQRMVAGLDGAAATHPSRVAGTMGLRRGIYIKPHRGAPLQRMLSAVGRGNTMLYWYTYGPDYSKGDSFSQNEDQLRLTSKAAHLLGKAEDALYGSKWAVPAKVAVVKPETTQRWMNLAGDPPHLAAAWENAKWVYTALQHAHIPVDPIDEQMLATADLSKYKAIYVSGSHVTRAAAEGLKKYVHQGGTLYTSGWGLARDEANQPLAVLAPVLGLKKRRPPEMWYSVSLYGAGRIEPYNDRRRQLRAVPKGARVTGSKPLSGSFAPVVGREVLDPAAGTEVLARFADGSAAVVRHRYGKGQAYTVGFYPGLEYSATLRRPDYDMARDVDAVRCGFVAVPALSVTKPVVDASLPLVEGVLLRNPNNGLQSVTLANWAYRVTGYRRDARGRRSTVVKLSPTENVTVTIRGAGPVARVTSAQLNRELKFSTSEGAISIRFPRLEEGDVLILKSRKTR
jgi:hypothetical protein